MKKLCLSLPLLLWVGVLLVSCGYQLRGYTRIPVELQVLYIQTDQPYSAFTQTLEPTLQRAGFQLVESPQQADVTLQILEESRRNQIGAISASTQTRQYLLYSTVRYQIKDSSGNVLIEPRSVTVSRSFIVDANQILGSTSAEITLEQEMREELAQRVITELASRSTIDAVVSSLDSNQAS